MSSNRGNQGRRSRKKSGRVGRPRTRPPHDPKALIPRCDDPVLFPADEDGTFVVLGGDLPGFGLEQLVLLPDRVAIGEEIARSAGMANVVAQGAHGLAQAQGLVRLAPETLRAMNAGAQPLTSGGWNLGSLARDGKIVQQVRWLPAGSSAAVGVLAAIGPAAALVAIQWQLAQITRLVGQNIARTNEVLRVVRVEQWSELQAYHETVMSEFANAQSVGAVTPEIWHHIEAQAAEATLRKHAIMFREHVEKHRQDLSQRRSAKDNRQWLVDNAEHVLRDVQALLLAQRTWFVYQAMRAASLATPPFTADRVSLQREVITRAKAGHTKALEDSAVLVDALYRHFRLMEVCPGGMGLTIKGRKSTPAEVREAAGALAMQLDHMGGGGVVEDGSRLRPARKRIRWIGLDGDRDAVRMRLRYVLPPEERVFAVLSGVVADSIFSEHTALVVVTEDRVLRAKKSNFLQHGAFEHEAVRSPDDRIEMTKPVGWKGGPELVVHVTGSGKTVHFHSGVTEEDVTDLADMLDRSARRALPART